MVAFSFVILRFAQNDTLLRIVPQGGRPRTYTDVASVTDEPALLSGQTRLISSASLPEPNGFARNPFSAPSRSISSLKAERSWPVIRTKLALGTSGDAFRINSRPFNCGML